MWRWSLRDLRWRRRRFALGVAGTALLFALTLLMSGLDQSLSNEAGRTLRAVGADVWVVPSGLSGPFTGISLLPASTADAVGRAPGVERADPLIAVPQVIRRPKLIDVVLFGHERNGLGAPDVTRGRRAVRSGEAVVDGGVGVRLGGRFVMRGQEFVAVGLTRDRSMNGGIPTAYVLLDDAQRLLFGGQPAAGAIVAKGVPERLPPGLTAMSVDEVKEDLMRPTGRITAAIDLVRLLLWVVATAVVGSLVYLSALERTGDFAVFKATGSSTASLMVGLAVQAVVVALSGGALAVVLAWLLRPAFQLPLEIPLSAVATMGPVALAVGLLASGVALRRVARIDPALAFGGP